MSIDAPENDTAYFSASGIGSFEFDYAEAFDEIAWVGDPDAFEALSQAMINHDLWFTCDFYSAQDGKSDWSTKPTNTTQCVTLILAA